VDLERKQYKDRFADKTDKTEEEKKIVTQETGGQGTGTGTSTTQKQVSTEQALQKKKNKKGRKFSSLSKTQHIPLGNSERNSGTFIKIGDKMVSLKDWLQQSSKLPHRDQKELLDTMREA
jgi:hypothetical protein